MRELAERVNKLGVKIDMSIGSNIRMRWIKIIVAEESDEGPDRTAGIGPRPPLDAVTRRGHLAGRARPARPARRR